MHSKQRYLARGQVFVAAICVAMLACVWPAPVRASDLLNSFEQTDAGNVESGRRAFDEGRYGDALKWLVGPAKGGDADAQLIVGLLYWYGLGVAKDDTLALNLFQHAAAQGNGRAMNVIGFSYQHGIGVSADVAKAAGWYEKGVQAGERRSFDNLGILYSEGAGVSKNPQKAAELWRDAADKGDSDAMVHLGDAYWYGKGVTQDRDAAVGWWNKATVGSHITIVAIGAQYLLGSNVPKDPEVAAKLFAQAVASGDPATEAALGWMYYNGEGVAKDVAKAQKLTEDAADSGVVDAMLYATIIETQLGNPARAAEWARRGAEKGNARTQAFYGIALQTGSGTGKDLNEAVLWFRRSADQGDAVGEYYLGRAYLTGVGAMAADLARANELIRQSAMQGYAPAQQALGENIANGNGFQRDDATAAKLFRASADQGDPQAMNEYGEALSSGRGVAKDAAQAAVWFERAAQYGDAHAMHSLAGLLFAGVGTTRDVLKSYYWAQAALRFYGQNELDDMPHAAQLRSELLAAIERAVPLQVRQKLDVEVAAFRPKIWSVPSPPLVVPNRGQLESDPSVAAF